MDIKINPHEVAIALSTFYPKWYRGRLRSANHTDKIRGDLALELLHELSKTEYQTVVIDTKSSNSFRKELAAINKIHLVKTKTAKQRSPSRRLAFQIASKLEGAKVIVYTDPEKTSFLNSIEAIVEPILRNETDIVIPKRENQLFKLTYPEFQYDSEVEGNRLYNELLKTSGLLNPKTEDYDLFFGPKAFRNDPKILSLFMRKTNLLINKRLSKHLQFNPEDFSNIIFFPIVFALKKKYRVSSIEIEFAYPALQKKNEESGLKDIFIEKRRLQKLAALIELMHFIQLLESNKLR